MKEGIVSKRKDSPYRSGRSTGRVGDNDVTESLLSQGWAELAEGVTEESYVEAEASARRIKAGIWGDGPVNIVIAGSLVVRKACLRF